MAVNERRRVFGFLLLSSRSEKGEISHVFGIGKEKIKIGRGRGNDIRLNSKLYSRYHVTLRIMEEEDGKLRVELVNESKQDNATMLQLPRARQAKLLPQGIPFPIDNLSVFFLQGRGFTWKENCEDGDESMEELWSHPIVNIFEASSLRTEMEEAEAEGPQAPDRGQEPSATATQIEFEQSVSVAEGNEGIPDEPYSQDMDETIGSLGGTSEAGGSQQALLDKSASTVAGSVLEDSEAGGKDGIGNARISKISELGGSQTTDPLSSPTPKRLVRPLRVSQLINSERVGALGSPATSELTYSDTGKTSKVGRRGSGSPIKYLSPSPAPKRRSSRRVSGRNSEPEKKGRLDQTALECSDVEATSELEGSQAKDPLPSPSPKRGRGRPRGQARTSTSEPAERLLDVQAKTGLECSGVGGTSDLGASQAPLALPSPTPKRGRPRKVPRPSICEPDVSLKSQANTAVECSDLGGTLELRESQAKDTLPLPSPARKRGRPRKVARPSISEPDGSPKRRRPRRVTRPINSEPESQATTTTAMEYSDVEGTSELGGPQAKDQVAARGRRRRAPQPIHSGPRVQTEDEIQAPNSTHRSRFGRTIRPVKRLSYK